MSFLGIGLESTALFMLFSAKVLTAFIISIMLSAAFKIAALETTFYSFAGRKAIWMPSPNALVRPQSYSKGLPCYNFDRYQCYYSKLSTINDRKNVVAKMALPRWSNALTCLASLGCDTCGRTSFRHAISLHCKKRILKVQIHSSGVDYR